MLWPVLRKGAEKVAKAGAGIRAKPGGG